MTKLLLALMLMPAAAMAMTPAEAEMYINEALDAGVASRGAVASKSCDQSCAVTNETVFSVNLLDIKDRYLYTGVTFATAAGDKIHIAGTMADNSSSGGSDYDRKDRFFIVFTPEHSQLPSQFVYGYGAVSIPVVKRSSARFSFGDEKFRAVINAGPKQAINPSKSKIAIENGDGKKIMEIPATTISRAMVANAPTVELKCKDGAVRPYAVMCTTQMLQDSKHRLSAGRDLIILLYPKQEGTTAQNVAIHVSEMVNNGAATSEALPGYQFIMDGKNFLIRK